MKAILNRSIHHPSSAPAHGVERASILDAPPDKATDGGDGAPTRDFLDLFRSRWNRAILHELRPRLSQVPPQLRRHQLNRRLPDALEKSVSNALDTLVDAGLVERTLPATGRGTLYSLTPDGVRILPMLREIDAICANFSLLLRRARNRGQSARCRRARCKNRVKR